MTEKRFFILNDEYEDEEYCIRDRTFAIKDIYGDYKYDDLNEICNELNKLVDTNRELFKENKQLKLQWITNQQEVECLTEENTKLKLENEYLKILDDGDIQ